MRYYRTCDENVCFAELERAHLVEAHVEIGNDLNASNVDQQLLNHIGKYVAVANVISDKVLYYMYRLEKAMRQH